LARAFGTHQEIFLDLASVPFLDPAHLPSPYLVGLAPGVTADQYIDSVADGGNTGPIAAHPGIPLRWSLARSRQA
jgi:hypothetical protein